MLDAPPNQELTAASRRFLSERQLAERKALGQYLTPRSLRERLLDRIPFESGMSVLDPGVGTGEFLLSVAERCPDARLVGWDVDRSALEVAAELVPTAQLRLTSALDVATEPRFDVVIGNPPYFQLRLTPHQRRRFHGVISGRPNIFALFFQVALDVLRPGGWLGFVVPPSMNNGAYFQALRDHITARASIEYLEVVDDARLFDGAQTAVQLIVLRKGHRSDRHVLDLQRQTGGPFHRTVLSESPRQLAAAFEGRSTLWALGYRAVTGSVVWNQNRHRLRRNAGEGTVPLIWAHNVADGAIALAPDHPKRPQFVVEPEPLEGPAIVVNRVVGAVGSASLRCALVGDGVRFVGENHVNVIVRRPDVAPVVGWDDLLAGLREPDVNERVVRLTGNTQLSATELTHLLPLSTVHRTADGPTSVCAAG